MNTLRSSPVVCMLRLLFVAVFLGMLGVTTWASLRVSIMEIPREVFTHPWFIATLFDAYFGFLTFYVWVAWKEQSWWARLLWFVAIMLLGNLAMAVYVLSELRTLKDKAELPALFSRRNPGHLALPASLVALAVAVYALA